METARRWAKAARSGALGMKAWVGTRRTQIGADPPRIVWPVGPHYSELALGDDRSWVDFKLASAEWYLQALRVLQGYGNPLDRYVGVEMAIDGVLAATYSAVDAAIGTLIRAIETHLDEGDTAIPQKLRARVWKGGWDVAAQLAALDPRVALSSRLMAESALVKDRKALDRVDPLIREKVGLDARGASRTSEQAKRLGELESEIGRVKVGVVAEMRMLRNGTTHHTTLTRAFWSEVAPVAIFSPLRVPKEPLNYLTDGLAATRILTEAILADASRIAP